MPARTVAILAVVLSSAVACRPRFDVDAVSHAIADTLQTPDYSQADTYVATAARAFYNGRAHQPAWADPSVARQAISALTIAGSHGLDVDYGIAPLQRQVDSLHEPARDDAVAPEEAARVDLELTHALLRAGRDVSNGRVPSSAIGARWAPRRAPEDLAGRLSAALEDGGLEGWLDDMAPSHDGYARLRRALAAARASQPDDPRLAVMALNLDRWRWMPDDLGERHVWVNIPEYTLSVREGQRRVVDMRVVVGGPGERQTPLFSDVMQTVVFNPYWHIPESIAATETVPAVLKDPEYLERNGIEVIDPQSGHRHVDPSDIDWGDEDVLRTLAFRQRPGDANALGQVKFLFPNRHAVYMHDTPSRALFEREKRALSHGCVRVADPVSLAAYVLTGAGSWTPDAVRDAMGGDREQHVKLTRPLAVHLVYFTAAVGDAGGFRQFDDIYELDRRQMQGLRRNRTSAAPGPSTP